MKIQKITIDLLDLAGVTTCIAYEDGGTWMGLPHKPGTVSPSPGCSMLLSW